MDVRVKDGKIAYDLQTWNELFREAMNKNPILSLEKGRTDWNGRYDRWMLVLPVLDRGRPMQCRPAMRRRLRRWWIMKENCAWPYGSMTFTINDRRYISKTDEPPSEFIARIIKSRENMGANIWPYLKMDMEKDQEKVKRVSNDTPCKGCIHRAVCFDNDLERMYRAVYYQSCKHREEPSITGRSEWGY